MDKQYPILKDANLRRQLIRVALAILDSPILAEEVVQEAYLRLLTTTSGAVESPSSWLVTVTRNLALDQARRRLRERKLLLLLSSQDLFELHDKQQANDIRLAEIISYLIDVSDSHVTAILLLHIVFGMSYEDIAIICGRPSAACRQAARRALSKCLNAINVDKPYNVTAVTDMYVHAILHATMSPLIDTLSETSPSGMQSCATMHSGKSCNHLPSTTCRTRQVLVLTDTGVKWAFILDGIVLCQFDNAVITAGIDGYAHGCSVAGTRSSSGQLISV